MARGFESKDIEFQQAEAERPKASVRPLTTGERDAADRRRSLELALVRVEADLAAARSPAHRRMLEHAIADLRQRLDRK